MSLSRHDGQMRPKGVEGLYVQDLRALSQFVLTVNGRSRWPSAMNSSGVRPTVRKCCGRRRQPGARPDRLCLPKTGAQPDGDAGVVHTRSYARATLSCHVELRFGVATWPLSRMSVLGCARRPKPPLNRDGLVVGRPGSRSGALDLFSRAGRYRGRKGAGVVGWDFLWSRRRVTEWSGRRGTGGPRARRRCLWRRPARNSGGFPVPEVDAN